MTIVWICTFSNEVKRAHLPLWRGAHGEYGQWIPNLLAGFRRYYPEIELHVISLQPWLRRREVSWVENEVHYYTISETFPVVHRQWPGCFPLDVWTQFRANRKRIVSLVKKINPDVVTLFGAENPEYAASILDIAPNYPSLVCLQGFAFREPFFPDFARKRFRSLIEIRILRECHNFIGEYESGEVVHFFNPRADCGIMYFPVNEKLIEVVKARKLDKKYDVLFVGRMIPQKGILDFIRVIGIIRKEYPNVRAVVVGRATDYPPAMKLVETLKLKDNIAFVPRFPDQDGLFGIFSASRVFLTPTYNDAFASTIRESMLLGTPVVSYKTGGIPYANCDGNENVVIVEQGDMIAMAARTLRLLQDDVAREAQGERGLAFAQKTFTLKRNVDSMYEMWNHLLAEAKKDLAYEL